MLRPGIPRLFRLAPWRRTAIEAELREELWFHLERRAAQFRAAGMSPDAAWEEAVRRFGSLDSAGNTLKQTARRREAGMRWSDIIDTIQQDTRYVLRQLGRAPGFTAAVTITLALGIGANATMFGVVDRLLLRAPANVAHPESLRRLGFDVRESGRSFTSNALSYAEYRDLRDSIPGMTFATYAFPQDMALGRGAAAEKIRGQLVGGPYFELLGTKPALGRLFSRDDVAEPTGQPVAVISEGFWQRHFAGAPDVLGKTLPIGQTRFTIVGVAPRYFTGTGVSSIDVWLPLVAAHGLRFDKSPNWMDSRNMSWLAIITRQTGDSSSLVAASVRATNVHKAFQPRDSLVVGKLTPILRRFTAKNSPDVKVARLLLYVSAFVLLIACANVANLLLARAVRRRQEMAVRLALGIDSLRLATLLFTESAVLAILGGAASLFVVQFGGGLVRARFLSTVNAWSESLVDRRVLAFTLITTFAVMLLIGLAPLLNARRIRLTVALKSSSAGGGRRRSRAHAALVVAQVTLCVVLLIGTGLFVRSLWKVNGLRLGIDTKQVLVANVDLISIGRSDAEIAAAYLRFAERVRALAGVQAATVSMATPFSSTYGAQISVPGLEKPPRVPDGGPYYNAVDEHYLTTMGTRLISGRGITAEDRAVRARVLVVNQSMAQLYWPGADPIGKCVKIGGDTMPCSTVVGVAENARRQSLIEGVSLQYLVPLERSPGRDRDRVLFVRVNGDADQMLEPVRRAMQSSAPDLPYANVRPMHSLLEGDFKPWTLGSTMFTIFGVVGLVLAIVGLYGTLAYDVAQRSRELSVRVALGAQSRQIVRLVMRGGVGLVLSGVVLGWLVALSSTRWVAELLYEVSPRDIAIYGGVGAALVVVGIVATAMPAWRATKVDLREAMAAE
jgi:predicted permease